MYKDIKKCRVCGNDDLVPIIDLGEQYLTGVFPRSKNQNITKGPLELVKCKEDSSRKSCGLVQLRQSYDANEMYGWNYGYRSALNKSMVEHLHSKVYKILHFLPIQKDDIVIDIGSNDCTLLRAYPKGKAILTGIDPAAEKFKQYYPDYIHLISDYFSDRAYKNVYGSRKAKIITSIAMFYDLENPLEFMQQIREILDDNGIWVFEQSYLPAMLSQTAYDTICHEHVEYYCLKQIFWMTKKVGFKIVDIEFNQVNGGSFSVIVTKSGSNIMANPKLVENVLAKENHERYNTLYPYEDFKSRVQKHKEELISFVGRINAENKKILGYGASTKGNVILQYCGITESQIPYIAEINEDKFGCFTPGTNIPIISEKEAKKMKPDYFLVLPWHFKENILIREKVFLQHGGGLIMPLPQIEILEK